MAMRGAQELANEIVQYWSSHGNGLPLTVFFPGGTCSTAVLTSAALHNILQQHSSTEVLDIRVVVIPCVGDQLYSRRQMVSLFRSIWGEIESMEEQIPAVLPPAPETSRYFGQASAADSATYYRFGEPDANILKTFREMQEKYGVVLDLIYGSPAWTILLRHFRAGGKIQTDGGEFDPLNGRELMYVHSGGLEGVNSQLMRYKYKGLIDEVQLPGRP